ncbi:hypothetical protein BV210_10610 [Halorientalis sp. IM1011]|uniref:oxygenase MpaB family protein n=1 Tax=Halorientalis sp. IM1011 TaxID=1932360 RepID=UPI00097CD59D|nr:oxygenase MpaB family protein [Halorientalis sp. IM1011]AQL43138.1 hypothetical protein BV210_10610 [Halorientalis sp. IM1011]
MAIPHPRGPTSDPLADFGIEVDADEMPDDIADLVADVDDPATGFFGPCSVMWRVNRENALFLVGVSSVLLQVGHPMVSAAGIEHSDFDEDLMGRFERTFDIVDTIVFGDVETAVEAAMIVRRMHESVVGELPGDAGRFEAGDGYYAERPDLMLWVHATLIDQSLVGYETYVDDLTDAERERYYEQSQIFGRLMGVPAEAYPETLADFYDYYERAIETDLAIGEAGEDVVETLFDQLGPLAPVARVLGAGSMPAGAREEFEQFGLTMTPTRKRLFDVFTRSIRAVPLWALPDSVRYREKFRLFGRHE